MHGVGITPEERLPDLHGAVEQHETRDDGRNHHANGDDAAGGEERLDETVLPEEAAAGRRAHERQRRDEEARSQPGVRSEVPGDPVPRPGDALGHAGQGEQREDHGDGRHQVEDTDGDAVLVACEQRGDEVADRGDVAERHGVPPTLTREEPDRADHHGEAGEHEEHRLQALFVREHQRERSHQGVHPDLGEDGGEVRPDASRRRGVGVGQPEPEREQRGLDGEHEPQHGGQHGDPQIGPMRRHPLGDVGHVQRANQAVRHAGAADEHGRGDQVHHDVLEPLTQLRQLAAEQKKSVRGDQHDFERYEQVEQITGEEAHVNAHEQELQQRLRPEGVAGPVQPSPAGENLAGSLRWRMQARGQVQHGQQPEEGAERKEQRAEPIGDERDPERRGPVGHLQGEHIAAQCAHGDGDGGSQGEDGRDGRHGDARNAPSHGQQHGARDQRHQDREGKQVHALSSSASSGRASSGPTSGDTEGCSGSARPSRGSTGSGASDSSWTWSVPVT